MASVDLTIDTAQLNAMSQRLARLYGQFDWIAARAMTNSAKAAKSAISRQILPMIQGGPTGWTKRGLISSFARPDNLRTAVGFQYGAGEMQDYGFTPKGVGVPAGRYMGVNARGGDRRPKATELALRRTGRIPGDAFITPNSKVLRLNSQGNLPGSQYQQLLSRLKSLPEGSSQNAKATTNRREIDYFIARRDGAGISRWQLGGEPAFIAKRAGKGPKGGTGKGSGRPGRPQTSGYKRGFAAAFFITDQPNYEARFPIKSVAMAEYKRVFAGEFDKALNAEIAFRNRRGR